MEIPSCKWCRNVKTESFERNTQRLKTQKKKKKKERKKERLSSKKKRNYTVPRVKRENRDQSSWKSSSTEGFNQSFLWSRSQLKKTVQLVLSQKKPLAEKTWNTQESH